jgi:hypothetical protein
MRARSLASRAWYGPPPPRANFLHIGKTAGSALKAALAEAGAGSRSTGAYRIIVHEHDVVLADVPEDQDFFFCVRDPVERFVSGFMSRQRQGLPRHDVPWNEDEAIAFSRFGSPDQLAVALSAGGERQREAEEAMSTIRHVNSSYWDWFGDADALRRRVDQLLWIGRVSTDEPLHVSALATQLGLTELNMPTDPVVAHKRTKPTPPLSEVGEHNARHWYAREYDFLRLCDELAPLIRPRRRRRSLRVWVGIR